MNPHLAAVAICDALRAGSYSAVELEWVEAVIRAQLPRDSGDTPRPDRPVSGSILAVLTHDPERDGPMQVRHGPFCPECGKPANPGKVSGREKT